VKIVNVGRNPWELEGKLMIPYQTYFPSCIKWEGPCSNFKIQHFR